MGTVLSLVALVFWLVAFVCNIIVLIHAFKSSVGEGFLCLCVPCYGLYYMFAKFEHPKKGLILGLYFGSSIIAGICYGVGMSMMQPSYGSYGSGGYGGY